MAITYITGIPRSGKSYYAVYRLWDLFINPKSKNKNEKIEFAYTNINKFKFDKNSKILPFDFNIFEMQLNELYRIYKMVDGKNDDLLIQKAKELKIYDALFIIDEAHNFLNDKENEILKWWLTYHGHLGHEIWLITQDLSLIATGYKSVAEFFYKAIPLSKRLFTKKFRYTQYSSYKMYEKDFISSFNIPMIKEVFELYHSGSLGNQKSLIHKFIYIFLLLVFILCVIFWFFISMFKPNEPKQKPVQNTQKSQKLTSAEVSAMFSNSKISTDFSKSEKFIYIFDCGAKFCSFEKNKILIPINLIQKITFENKPIFSEKIDTFSGNFSWYLVYDNEIFKFLKEVSYEKNSNFTFVDSVSNEFKR